MTYEEISTRYPIGKLLARTIDYKWETGYWANEADKNYYRSNFSSVRFYDTHYAEYKIKIEKEYRVEGWICTEEGFFVAENTWDGWQPLDDDDLAEIEAKGITPNIFDF